MDHFYQNPMAPEKLRRQLQAARQRSQQEQQQQQQQGRQQSQAQAQQQQQQQQQPRQLGQPGILNMSGMQQDASNDQRSPRHPQNMMPSMGIDNTGVSGDSIDDIISQNTAAESHRRRSLPQSYSSAQGQAQTAHDDADRRMSMMEFGSSNDNYRGFQFGNHMSAPGVPSSMADGMSNFGNMSTLTSPMDMQSTANFNNPLGMSDPNDFSSISPDVMGNMMGFSNLNMGSMSSNPNAMPMFGNANMGGQFENNMDSVSPDFTMDMNPTDDPMSTTAAHPSASMGIDGVDDDMMAVPQVYGGSGGGGGSSSNNTTPTTTQPQSQQANNNPLGGYGIPPSLQREASGATSFPQTPTTPLSQTLSTARPSIAPETPMGAPNNAPGQRPMGPDAPEANFYSKSGFDMIRALYYVSTRPNPEIQLGAVDFSCAFVVCDVTMNDCPIIYVSDNFQNLTGYSRHDIVGQNCRFLQAPDGKVEAGTKREFVENDAVYNLKKKVQEGRECQQGLINYRKGGKPFLNLLTMIPIPWDSQETRYFIGFQIDLVECPDAIAGTEKQGTFPVNYKHSDIGQYIWTPPQSSSWDPESGQTLGLDDVSTLLQQFKPGVTLSDWHKQSWDKMLLENTDDVVHVLSLKGLFLYLSPSCKKILEYDPSELVGNPISSICHPSDIVPITRELKDTAVEKYVNIVFRVRRKQSGYTWFESHGSLFVEQGKGRKCIILVGRKRPVFALSRRDVEANGGIGDGELWTKLSTSGMFLFVASNVRSLLDLQPDQLVGTSIQDYMRKETRPEFGRAIEKARRGRIVSCKHEVQNRRGQVLQASTVLYPGDASEGQKPTFLLAQTKLLKASSRILAPASSAGKSMQILNSGPPEDPIQPSHGSLASPNHGRAASGPDEVTISAASGGGLSLGSQDVALASDDNIFEELKTTRCSSWQFELRQMEKVNRLLAEQLGTLLSNKKKRKRRKGVGNAIRDCANCHTRNTPEWRRGPSGNRDLCNSCGLRWAKQTGRVSPRTSSRGGGDGYSKKSSSPNHSSPLHREITNTTDPSNSLQNVTDGHDSGKVSRSPSTNNTQNAAAVASSNNNINSTPVIGIAAAAAVAGGGGNANNGGGGSGGTTPFKGMMPPPSQPMLEGGSGTDGHSMGMTSIQEEDTIL